LHAELVRLQEWVKYKGLKVCVVFEGRDGAGKGGTIKAITERVSPRVFRVVALPAPTEREKSQMYLQRYIKHLPAGGEVAIFDRSWYNRAGVERVMGFSSEDEVQKFLRAVPLVERAIVDSGVILIKYWLEVSQEEQTRRLEERIADGRKIWKLSGMDLDSYGRWYDYSKALVRGPLGRQAAGSSQHHLAPAQQGSVQERAAREGEAPRSAEGAWVSRAGLSVQVRHRAVLRALCLLWSPSIDHRRCFGSSCWERAWPSSRRRSRRPRQWSISCCCRSCSRRPFPRSRSY
jgi:polyphosphate kinase 2